jgi:hypothetical protein
MTKTKTTTSKKEQPLIILFYMIGCTHCDTFMRTDGPWTKNIVPSGLKTIELEQAEEDSAIESKLSPILEEHLIRQLIEKKKGMGYPTIIKVNGGTIEEYEGNRENIDELLSWTKSEKKGGKKGNNKKGNKKTKRLKKKMKKTRKYWFF